MQADPARSAALPVADADSAAHSARVSAVIREAIAAAGGSISFSEYMQLVLYTPGLGYYAAGTAKFGEAGDFITAPEVSPLFGRVVGRQCATVLSGMTGAGVLELGAGSGALAVDILRSLAEHGVLPGNYCILEPSAELQQRQRQRFEQEIPELCERIDWLTGWPRQHRGVVVANEVADALPVMRFLIRDGRVCELRVGTSGGGFAWLQAPAPEPLEQAVRRVEAETGHAFADGFVSEICLALPSWIGDLADSIAEGFVFLFDYGTSRREYYAAERDRGWLRCHFRHRAHEDPFLNVGIQDLTSWVDFSAVADAASAHGMEIAGYLTQADFLLHGGLQEELADFASLPSRQRVDISRQVKILTLPGEMGEHCKCMGLRKGAAPIPAVFGVADRAHTL